ncbi:MAG: hypothetical protein MSG64_01975 [Pyrinomonadaceae bacterium MAG19_C2-C3]|nr:hypothetical protein [Pyrinomonadaceae bacterium MAG19_C2-C3]
MKWHVLDTLAIWIKEFASALSKQVPTLGWIPRISEYGLLQRAEHPEIIADSFLEVRYFPLQRGYSFAPVSWATREGKRVYSRLAAQTQDVTGSPLICTSPHYIEVAERWRGPVIYYVTDMIVAYEGQNPRRVRRFDKRLCGKANLVCPNSQRVADYLIAEAGCAESKIAIVPNATRASNLLNEPPTTPLPFPVEVAALSRPVAGVIGNMGGNIDWLMLEAVIKQTPWLSWLFVGPTVDLIKDISQAEARRRVIKSGERVRFVGSKPYGELRDYARAFDVAVLPYKKREPTYSGSSTRFYEHLAACRPMISTKGFEMLLHKEPLLKIVEDAAEMTAELERLRALNFQDGYEELRWQTSQHETWEARATQMREALKSRM